MRPATISLEEVTRGIGVEPLDFKSAGVRAIIARVTINSGSDPLTRTSHIY